VQKNADRSSCPPCLLKNGTGSERRARIFEDFAASRGTRPPITAAIRRQFLRRGGRQAQAKVAQSETAGATFRLRWDRSPRENAEGGSRTHMPCQGRRILIRPRFDGRPGATVDRPVPAVETVL
jgi:hypothetical protein